MPLRSSYVPIVVLILALTPLSVLLSSIRIPNWLLNVHGSLTIKLEGSGLSR